MSLRTQQTPGNVSGGTAGGSLGDLFVFVCGGLIKSWGSFVVEHPLECGHLQYEQNMYKKSVVYLVKMQWWALLMIYWMAWLKMER